MKRELLTHMTLIKSARWVVIDLPTIQKKLNLHYTLSLDLFGSEVSTNAANAFNSGIKGRYQETKIDDDHQLQNDTYAASRFTDGKIELADVPALTAINMRLRDDYTKDASGGVKRWNHIIAKQNIEFDLLIPHSGFNRKNWRVRRVRQLLLMAA